MPDLILHHYPNSPFSEKVRSILGYKKLAWKSVIIPVIMPKPNVTALTGGYRRTPLLQIGADIYCDTALIADVLERIAPEPSLYPPHSAGLARTLAQWADSTLFWTVIAYAFQPAALPSYLGSLTPEQMKAFAADRATFRADLPRMAPGEAAGILPVYLRRLEDMLADGKSYLLGEQPSIADFAVYHSLWFLKLAPAVSGILDDVQNLKAWTERMAAVGHHQYEKLSAEQALDIARNSTPGTLSADGGKDFFDAHGIGLGERVTIMPADYGLDPVEGQLVLSTESAFALRRTDPQAGTVVVHFPRVGFQLKKVQTGDEK